MLGRASFHSARGRHYAVRTRNVANLTPDVILALVRAGAGMTSPFSGITVRHFHGHGTRIPAADTAFGIRREHFVVEVVAGWSPGDHDAVLHRTCGRLARYRAAPIGPAKRGPRTARAG